PEVTPPDRDGKKKKLISRHAKWTISKFGRAFVKPNGGRIQHLLLFSHIISSVYISKVFLTPMHSRNISMMYDWEDCPVCHKSFTNSKEPKMHCRKHLTRSNDLAHRDFC